MPKRRLVAFRKLSSARHRVLSRRWRVGRAKTDRPYHKDRGVQTIIGEIILKTCPSSKEFSQDSISASDRNRQNRFRKWWYLSLKGSGQYLSPMEKWRTREHDRRYLTQNRNQKGKYSGWSWKATQRNAASAGDVTYLSAK